LRLGGIEEEGGEEAGREENEEEEGGEGGQGGEGGDSYILSIVATGA